MKTPKLHLTAVVLLAVVQFSCTNMFKLQNDLDSIKRIVRSYSIDISFDDAVAQSSRSPVILISLQDKTEQNIGTYRFIDQQSRIEFNSGDNLHAFFAFADLNQDFIYQKTEPFSLVKIQPASLTGNNTHSQSTMKLNYPQPGVSPVPHFLVGVHFSKFTQIFGVNINVGTVTSIDSPLFTIEHGKTGMWEPLTFLKSGGFGVHMLQKYEPEKIPVLFVHGIGDGPVRFKTLISKLDNSKYQAWVYSYPTAYRLQNTASGLSALMKSLHYQYRFSQLHIVAHSMGGLVSKAYINECSAKQDCPYLTSFTTISTPWIGHQGAQSGVTYSPVVMPSWIDMSPESQFLADLFNQPLTVNLQYNLLFTFKTDKKFNRESSDGVISLHSQLRRQAQNSAVNIKGYDQTHTSILYSETMSADLFKLFKLSEQP